MKQLRLTLLPGVLALTLTACGDSSDSVPGESVTPEPIFSAEVRRTEYGIPHIKAEDWSGLGYGYGYAYAQDNFCVAMREIVIAGGRSAELMGSAGGDVQRDLLFRYLNGSKEEFRADFVTALPEYAQDLVAGYAAGMNRYLRETGVDNLPMGDAGCRGEPWVVEIDDIDVWQYLRRIALGGSSDQGLIREGLIAAQGPDSEGITAVDSLGVAPLPGRDLAAAGEEIRPSEVGSNAVVAGRDATQAGNAVLLGNPHQPWSGSGRWYEAHLTIPGVYDVAGASLQGLPWIGIGFTQDVAWTHTVAFASRFTLYELKLNPSNPLEYDYDGEWRPITEESVAVQARREDGTLETVERTFYSSHYGMIVDLGGVNPLLAGWPLFNGSLMTIRDANLLTGIRSAREYIEKAQATSMEEYTAALANVGNPVFHDFAADRNGSIFYGNTSAVPHVTQDKYERCVVGVGALLAGATSNAIIGLDGSTSDCEWGEDEDSPADSNLFGYSSLAKITGTGYVGNSNNSYWLSDANNPLTGFPVVQGWLGWEGQQQFLRTRITHLMVDDRLNRGDELSETPLFDLETMKGLMYANRVYGAEVVLDDVLQICSDYLDAPPQPLSPGDANALAGACDVLASWDRKVDLDSRGAQVFTEFWGGIRAEYGNDYQNVVQSDVFWRVDFDPADPLNTPRGIDVAVADNRDAVITALLRAHQRLTDAGVALDAPWSEVQYLERNNENVPIHGGAGTMGVFGAISVSLKDGGYINPSSGNSYIQVVTWDESDCPIADTILTHSQSTDPESPHYGDQTRLYADKRWVRFPFCESDIAAQQIGETLLLEE
tara:strand:+ start:423044 stop:425527 length:2484 start_codon:yes stop_codon:yes gene_type:complete